MTETTIQPGAVEKTPTARHLGFPTARLASVVDTTTEMAADVLTSLETGERSAVEAVGKFLINLEEAWPQQVAGTSDVVKKITVSGLQMTDRLIETEYEVLRDLIAGATKPLGSRETAGPQAS